MFAIFFIYIPVSYPINLNFRCIRLIWKRKCSTIHTEVYQLEQPLWELQAMVPWAWTISATLVTFYYSLEPAGSSGCMGHSHGCGKQAALSVPCRGLLTLLWLLLWSTELQAHGLFQQLPALGSEHRPSQLYVTGLSCSAAWDVFLDQGLEPCHLHWKADSLSTTQEAFSHFYSTDIGM